MKKIGNFRIRSLSNNISTLLSAMLRLAQFLSDKSRQQWQRATWINRLASGTISTAKSRYGAEAKQQAKYSNAKTSFFKAFSSFRFDFVRRNVQHGAIYIESRKPHMFS
jgi:hypothetical protein